MVKPDRKALMRKSIEASQESDKAAAARRLELAENAMSAHPKGLMAPAVPTRLQPAPAEAPAAEGVVCKLPIERVHDNPFNARKIYDPEVIKELAMSLATGGQLVPAPAVPHPTIEGHYVLIDGHYRKKGLVHAGKDEITCIVGPAVDEIELYRLSFVINEQRNAQSTLDNAIAWHQLLEEKRVESSEAIAEMLGISKSLVSKTLALLKMPESALAKMQEMPSKFSMKVGYELTLFLPLLDELELLDLVDKVVEEDMSARQLEAMRARITTKPPRKTKETSRQYKIRGQDGVAIGAIKVWDVSGKVALEIKLADPKQRGELLETLKRQFGLDENLFG